jgi:hypothetical protein
MKRLLMLLPVLILLGCAGNVHVVKESINFAGTQFCFSTKVNFQGKRYTMTGCTASPFMCYRAQGLAQVYGGYAGITGVTSCERRIINGYYADVAQ